MSKLPVINNLVDISGFTSYDKFLGCGRRVRLDKEQRFEGESDGGTEDTRVGTALHAILAHHYLGFPVEEAELGTSHPFEVDEAWRLYNAYKKKYKDEFLIDVAFAEYKIERHDPVVEQAVGISPFSCIIDLGTYLSEECILSIPSLAALELEEGFYIWDHKSTKSGGGQMVDRQSNNLQFTSYMLAFKAKFPDVPLMGMIANIVVRTKAPQFSRLFIRPPSHIEVNALTNMWNQVDLRLKTDPDYANPKDCFYWTPCSHYVYGRCPRY